jgi:DNA-binding NarL/FixJ family response regulator
MSDGWNRAPTADVAGRAGETVAVLADDLIWATRLVGQLRTLGAVPVRAGSADAFAAVLASGAASRAVVDLTARGYDGVAMTRRATAAGLRVLCVGQHDDRALRTAALAAGADRVHAYRKLFEDGHAALAAWLGVAVPAPGTRAVPAPADPADPAEAPPA